MKTSKIKVNMENGQEARPIALLVQEAGKFESKIYLEIGTKKVNAKSIMGMMSLGMAGGDEVVISAEGEDEDAALDGVCKFLSGEK
ncbi:MAG: HPr family phosphocarrier protein [Lachnospiraceae bacterium]|nr:HPr family phosphocarrier protein [Lachnospiraceae bacterium]